MNKRFKKPISVLICALFVIVLVLSATLSISHAGHCCHPKGCPVCLQIENMLNLLRQLAFMLAALALWLQALSCARSESRGANSPPHPVTLVTLNIRMNN